MVIVISPGKPVGFYLLCDSYLLPALVLISKISSILLGRIMLLPPQSHRNDVLDYFHFLV